MKLPQIALKNYQFVIILVVLGLFLGISSLMTMPRSEDPNPNFPIYTIIVVYPGTSPEDLEELVVDPIEEAIEEIPDIEKINTEIEDGVVKINVEGAFGINVDDQYDEVVAEVNTIRDRLPADIFSLDFVQFKPQERVYIQQFALVSTEASYRTLNDHAEALEYELEKISGVSQAEIFAAPQEEVRISLDFQKMARQNIPLSQVIGVLQGNNINIPGGVIKSGQKSFNIKSSGGYENLDEIKATVVSAAGDRIVYLKDIAEVRMDYEDLRWIARYQGDPAVFINLTQEENENVVSLGEKINLVAQEYKEQLPSNIQLVTAFEQAPAVSGRISGFFINLLQGVVLVGVIILIFLGWRPALIIMMVIPIAILLAIGALDLSGFAWQQISIAALVIALGLLVDNGIVVIENIIRLHKEGLSWTEAAVQGTSEVGYAIISSTVTTLLAFFPLALMQSGPGEFLRSLPVTVILVLIASLLLALTLTPILAGRLMKSSRKPKPRRVDKAVSFGVQKYYRPVLNFALAKPWRILLIAVGVFLGSLMLFPFIGVSFFPTADKPVLLIEVDTPEGSNLEATDWAVKFVEQVLDTTEYVSHYSSNVGHGNPMVYYNRVNEEYAKTHGQLLVNFDGWDPDRFYQALADFKKIFSKYSSAKITFSELKNGPPFEAPIEIKLLGENLDTLKRLAFKVEELVRNTEGTQNIDNPLAVYKTNLKVDINRDKAGLLGLPLAGIDQSVRASLNGITVDEVTL
ncbi:MAG: efflux RND transporter permease subunit, partial [Cyclobacteriaceae bacterium]